MDIEAQINVLLDTLKTNQENPDGLSQIIVELAAINYKIGSLMAQAKLEEVTATLKHMNAPSVDGKKTTVSESERRGIEDTLNEYELLKNHHDDIVEIINATKKRLDLLSLEHRNG